MRKRYLILFILFACYTGAMAEAYLEYKLKEDIKDGKLDNFSKPQAAFILSGATQQDSLAKYMDWYNNLVDALKAYNFDPFEREQKAASIFAYLHSNWLIEYKEMATTLLDVVKEKRFNCVAGTILFNLICEDMDLETEAFETPTHTYTIFKNFDRQFTVENTSGMGFNIMQNLREYTRYLRQFYPDDQTYKIGLDRLYAYENSNGRQINNTELLGLLAYNRAYLARENNDFSAAYDYVTLAQYFNADSRSNINFEINLYQTWAYKLYELKRYDRAFQVYADACYRYPDIDEFKKNTVILFFKAQDQNWRDKNWQSTNKLTLTALDRGILSDEELSELEKKMGNWGNYALSNHKKELANEVAMLWAEINKDSKYLAGYLQAIQPLNRQ